MITPVLNARAILFVTPLCTKKLNATSGPVPTFQNNSNKNVNTSVTNWLLYSFNFFGLFKIMRDEFLCLLVCTVTATYRQQSGGVISSACIKLLLQAWLYQKLTHLHVISSSESFLAHVCPIFDNNTPGLSNPRFFSLCLKNSLGTNLKAWICSKRRHFSVWQHPPSRESTWSIKTHLWNSPALQVGIYR